MKKLLRNIGILLIGIMVVLFVGYKFFGWFDTTDNYTKNQIKKLETYNVEIMIYGSVTPCKEVNLQYKEINDLTETSIQSEKTDSYHLIVVNDLEGNIEFSDDELKLVKQYCESKHYDFIYFGTTKKEQFLRCGFTNYDEEPFMYQGYLYVNRKAPEFNGTDWYDSETDTYYANPYWLMFEWDERNTEAFRKDSAELLKKVVSLALYSIEG